MKLILINRILSDVSLKADVQILSLMKIKEDPYSICRALNQDEQSNIGLNYMNIDSDINDVNTLIQEDLNFPESYSDEKQVNTDQNNSFLIEDPTTKKVEFKNNYLEIGLQGEYFNTINFIRLLQNYEITIMPVCINIGSSSYQQSMSEQKTKGTMNSKFIINIPTEKE